MRPFIFLFGIFIACSASLTKRKCNPDPDDCKTGLLQFNTCHVSKNQREKQGIDQDLFDKLRFFSQIAAASYWPGNNNSTGDLLKCSGDSCPNIPEDNCPDVENSEYTTVSEWQDVAQFDDHGFIAISQTDELISLAFRGTDSDKNWAGNLKMDLVSGPEFCDCCTVHQGFWESWKGVRDSVIKSLTKIHEENPDYRIAVVGHSLGGALATIAAGEIRNQGSEWTDNIELYTYGSPRIGNTETVRFLSQQSNQSYRVTAMKDPVPRVPFTKAGYQHTSPEYWIGSNPDDPEPKDVKVLWGYFNPNGVNRFDTIHDGIHIDDHHHYFGTITSCDPSAPNATIPTDLLGFL